MHLSALNPAALLNSAAHVSSEFDGPAFTSIIEADTNDFASITALKARLEDGSLTSVQLVTRALARIAALDREGPSLQAVIETNSEALDIAASLDVERAAGTLRGPLHGIPVLIKDSVDTGDCMQTSAGSPALVGEPAAADAYVVQRLRAAGAVVLGKTNLSEWVGMRDWSTMPLGWSGRGGQTRSAVGLDFPVHGSSAGSAVAVSAGYSPMAVATETNGSLVGPAMVSGVVGLRPTLGLLDQFGLVPLTKRQDTAGPMARSVMDAALLLAAMFGVDGPGPVVEGAPTTLIDYASGLDSNALQGAKLGYPAMAADGTPLNQHPEFAIMAARLERAGATLVPVDFTFPSLNEAQIVVLCVDVKRELATYLASRPGIAVKTLADVIAFNTANPDEAGYGQDMLQLAESLSIPEPLYQLFADQLRNESRKLIDDALAAHGLVALVDLTLGYLAGYGAQAGYPGLTVPAGSGPSGRPMGLYFAGSKWSDQTLLSLGYAFEQAGD
ncbi:amidase [Pseudomonas entomophila]|uniref:amidase family protein n=1 Tax=Pseudomonas entomophila TaxID=312306 RepID=UPI001BCD0C09|nr:amidase family protein [Pseudomonas entomophila]QVM91753.1 amidase [Pseudomonas entomophila]